MIAQIAMSDAEDEARHRERHGDRNVDRREPAQRCRASRTIVRSPITTPPKPCQALTLASPPNEPSVVSTSCQWKKLIDEEKHGSR